MTFQWIFYHSITGTMALSFPPFVYLCVDDDTDRADNEANTHILGFPISQKPASSQSFLCCGVIVQTQSSNSLFLSLLIARVLDPVWKLQPWSHWHSEVKHFLSLPRLACSFFEGHWLEGSFVAFFSSAASSSLIIPSNQFSGKKDECWVRVFRET